MKEPPAKAFPFMFMFMVRYLTTNGMSAGYGRPHPFALRYPRAKPDICRRFEGLSDSFSEVTSG